MPKKIPYSVTHFEKIRQDKYFFVDKTKYIAELEKSNIPVFLRPRRFGKSMWCSILECYYDINRVDKFENLFGGLYIGDNPTPDRNKYMVLRLNFSKVEVNDDADFISDSFNFMTNGEINSFVIYYKEYFQDFKVDKSLTSARLLESVLLYINDHNLPPMYIVIDEYDNFTNQLITTHKDTLYYDLTTGDSFFRTFFKVIKAGFESQAIGRVFITGVLPITMDDLTSGFNIAEFITLKKTTLNMLGFTQIEVDQYLSDVYESYELDRSNFEEVRRLLIAHYNGYRFSEDTEETLYNSTILTFFLKNFALDGGEIPREVIDDNLRTDINWIRRLTGSEEKAREMIETLIFDNEMKYDNTMLRSKFNMNQFFEKDFYPVSLFYLGMVTFKDDFKVKFPNLSMKRIFTEYFNDVERIEVSKGYTDIFEQFLIDLNIEKLFAGYWKEYVGQLPAQLFDKVNENFYRTTFFELCTRYLSHVFTFSAETNYPSGRSDWEAVGKPHRKYKNKKFLVEFKYYSNKKGREEKILELEEAKNNDIEQVKQYETDIITQFPEYEICSNIIYIVGNSGFKCFEV